MTETWALAALWVGLALAAALLAIFFRIANALGEIMVGIAAGALIGAAALGSDLVWVKFLSGTGAIVLTFLAGAELDPVVFRAKWKEATAVGLVSFAAPFLGGAATGLRRGCRNRSYSRRLTQIPSPAARAAQATIRGHHAPYSFRGRGRPSGRADYLSR